MKVTSVTATAPFYPKPMAEGGGLGLDGMEPVATLLFRSYVSLIREIKALIAKFH